LLWIEVEVVCPQHLTRPDENPLLSKPGLLVYDFQRISPVAIRSMREVSIVV
jgi:hypothetical protein